MSPTIGSAGSSEIEAKDQQFRIGGETKALYEAPSITGVSIATSGATSSTR